MTEVTGSSGHFLLLLRCLHGRPSIVLERFPTGGPTAGPIISSTPFVITQSCPFKIKALLTEVHCVHALVIFPCLDPLLSVVGLLHGSNPTTDSSFKSNLIAFTTLFLKSSIPN